MSTVTSHRQIVLDTETTGLSPQNGDRLIEIGCIELINRKFTGHNLHLYINPQRDIDQDAIDVHGITNEFLSDKPVFDEVVQQVMRYLNGAELIIHNAAFDIGFINHELQHYTKMTTVTDITECCTVLDTLAMARKRHPGQRNSLDALCKRYDVDNRHRQLHGALLDAQILAQVYLAMTGGQKNLAFEQAEEVVQDVSMPNAVRQVIDRTDLNLVVQKASAAEQQAHAAYLERLQTT